jgi:hypothetical protein
MPKLLVSMTVRMIQGGALMIVLRFFAVLFCLLFAVQTFPSEKIYAASKKLEKGTKQCCMPGAVCPTPQTDGSPGCKCCGFRVDGKLVDYKGVGIDSTLELDGITVTFVVTDQKVDSKLKAIAKGANGQFVLKVKEFANSSSPTGHGMRIDCIDVGNTSIENRTKQFLLGSKISDSVYEVTEALLNAVPKYDPELQEDK